MFQPVDAEEAMFFYTSIIEDSKKNKIPLFQDTEKTGNFEFKNKIFLRFNNWIELGFNYHIRFFYFSGL